MKTTLFNFHGLTHKQEGIKISKARARRILKTTERGTKAHTYQLKYGEWALVKKRIYTDKSVYSMELVRKCGNSEYWKAVEFLGDNKDYTELNFK